MLVFWGSVIFTFHGSVSEQMHSSELGDSLLFAKVNHHQTTTLPKFNSSPLKRYRNPIGKKGSSSKHHVSGENSLLNFRGVFGRIFLVHFFHPHWRTIKSKYRDSEKPFFEPIINQSGVQSQHRPPTRLKKSRRFCWVKKPTTSDRKVGPY